MLVNGIPLDRLVWAAETLGSQEADACPPHETERCWCDRCLEPFGPLVPDAATCECRECWILWLLKGE